MSNTKRYGLILPAKKPGTAIKRAAAFEGDSSSDEQDSTGRSGVNASLRREATKKTRLKQTQDVLNQAISEDPSVFEYDSVYDQMQAEKQKADPRLSGVKSTKPKYISALKKTAERRKIEQEIIYERKVQREMEAENDQFGDKESYVTSAYKIKLAERKKLEAELEKEAAIEASNDVKKQNDLGKFYQNLLKQKTSKVVSDKRIDEAPLSSKVDTSIEKRTDEAPLSSKVDTSIEKRTDEAPLFSKGPDLNAPFVKRTNKDALESVRSRYFARKNARQNQ